MPYVWFLVLCTVWGGSFILMKKAVLVMSPVSVGAWRVLTGGLVLAAVWRWLGLGWHFRRADFWPMFALATIGMAWPYSVQPLVIGRQGSAFVAMTVGFTPLATILLSWLAESVRPTARQMIGVIGAIVFLGVLVQDGLNRSVSLFDLTLALSVPVGYAICNLWTRRALVHVPAVEVSSLGLIASGLLLLPLCAIMPAPQGVDWPLRWYGWGAASVLGIFGTGIAWYIFTRLVKEQGALFAGMVTNLTPALAVCWGLADGETVSTAQWVSLGGLIVMVLLVQWGAAQPAHSSLKSDTIEETTSTGIAPDVLDELTLNRTADVEGVR